MQHEPERAAEPPPRTRSRRRRRRARLAIPQHVIVIDIAVSLALAGLTLEPDHKSSTSDRLAEAVRNPHGRALGKAREHRSDKPLLGFGTPGERRMRDPWAAEQMTISFEREGDGQL